MRSGNYLESSADIIIVSDAVESNNVDVDDISRRE